MECCLFLVTSVSYFAAACTIEHGVARFKFQNVIWFSSECCGTKILAPNWRKYSSATQFGDLSLTVLYLHHWSYVYIDLRTWFDFDNTSEFFFLGGGISCMPQTRKCSAATYLFLLHMHLHHWTWGILLAVGLGPEPCFWGFYALIWKCFFTLVTAILLLLLGPDTSGLIGTACIGMKPSLLRISDTLFPW